MLSLDRNISNPFRIILEYVFISSQGNTSMNAREAPTSAPADAVVPQVWVSGASGVSSNDQGQYQTSMALVDEGDSDGEEMAPGDLLYAHHLGT